MTTPRYLTQRQYGEWCVIDTRPGIDVTIAVGCPIGVGGTPAGRAYAERIAQGLNAVSDLLGMLETLCDGLEWNIENHPTVMNESDSEALLEARALIAKQEHGAQPDLYDLPSLIDAHDDALALLAERDAEIAELNIRLAEYRQVDALATAALEKYFALYGAMPEAI